MDEPPEKTWGAIVAQIAESALTIAIPLIVNAVLDRFSERKQDAQEPPGQNL